MKFWQAIILGLLQGLTEFLPVSSSGHLILMRDIFGISGDYLFFDVMLHAATLVAVCVVLYKEIAALIYPRPSKKLLYLIIASVPAVITGVLAALFSDEFFESGRYLCFFFLITAALLLLAEIFGKKSFIRNKAAPKDLDFKNILYMGLAQSAAVLPGLSRSGSTISAGILTGGEKDSVAKFSFLMSIPIILGSAAFESLSITEAGVGAGELIIGMLCAAVSGFVAIKVMLKAVARCNYKWFSLYLTVLAFITFVNYFVVPIW